MCLSSYILRVIKNQDSCQELDDRFSCCTKSLKRNISRSTCGCYEFKKEIVCGLGAVTWSW